MISRLTSGLLRLLANALRGGLLLALACQWTATPAHAASLNVDANDLLREAVANEKAASNAYLAWTDRVERPHGSVTRMMVNTPQGLMARAVAVNDQPLSAAQRQQEEERVGRLLDPALMREKARKQREDRQRIERLLTAVPDALRCDYSPAQPQEGAVRLQCSPNPRFSPPNYESQVLVGMQGEIVIDRNEKRLTRISGTLVKDVTFGWGFLARLKRGGRIEIEQSKVVASQWSITRIDMRFEGKIVLLKPLHVQQTESCWNFRLVPEMSIAQALEYLRNTPTPSEQ